VVTDAHYASKHDKRVYGCACDAFSPEFGFSFVIATIYFGPARPHWSGPTSLLVEQGALARESIDANFRPEICRRACLPVLQRRPRGVSHAIDGIEKPRNTCGIDQPLGPYGVQKGLPGLDEAIVLATENGLAEAHQELTMRHAAVTNTGGDDRETVVFAFVFRARTEQL
jgi:hypothetical protein